MKRRLTAAEFVAEALSWKGTPFGHQQPLKGVAVDCANFIAGVAAATHATPDTLFERNYRRREDGTQMVMELVRYMGPVRCLDERGGVTLEHALPGDVLALHDGADFEKPRHLAFLTQLVDGRGRDYPKMCHASARGVVCHRIDAHFRGLIHSIWRVPGLVY
jgi:hypothetical protein